jgi:ubiquinone/menaquinone biosynthesis C-methylase UbiE
MIDDKETLSAVADYWDENVANWKIAKDLEMGSSAFFQEVERYRFDKLDYLPRVIDYQGYSGQSVLDVGCGLATDLSRFAAQGARVTGIDISAKAIDLAQKNFAQRELDGEFIRMDGQAMNFPDNTFDLVYCHTVLHFTPDPEAMLKEISRVLKPGGRALLMTINRSSWLFWLHRWARLKIDYMDAPVFHKFNYAEFDKLTAMFNEKELIVERFPVRTEVHRGLKAFVYNTCFVDFYNALPKALTGKSGYHLLAWVGK